MKKFILLLFSLLFLMMSMYAEEYYAIKVVKLNGQEYSQAFAIIGRLEFTGDSMYLVSTDGQILGRELRTDVHKIAFGNDSTTAISSVEMDAKINKEAGPELTLSFIDRNYVTTVYEFYTRDSDSYYVVKNGEYRDFYVYSREIFNNGGTDTYNYGYWKAFELLNDAISGNSNGIYDISKDI